MNVPPPLLLPVIYRGGGGCGAQPNFFFCFLFFCRTNEGRNDDAGCCCCRIYLNIAVSRQGISLPSFHAADDARRTTTATKTIALWIVCCIISWLRRGRTPKSRSVIFFLSFFFLYLSFGLQWRKRELEAIRFLVFHLDIYDAAYICNRIFLRLHFSLSFFSVR